MPCLRRQPLTVEFALLGFLQKLPGHGYEIHQYVSDPVGLGLVWHVKQSHLYAMLERLEAEGYIAGKQQVQDTRPPRRTFHLTPTGRKAFRDWLRQPVIHGRDVQLEFIAKLFFARRERPESVARLIKGQRLECTGWLSSLMNQTLNSGGSGSYEWLVYRNRIGQVEAILAWLDLCAEVGPGPAPNRNTDSA